MSTPEHSQGRNFPNQKFGWVLEPDGTWSLYSETGAKLISTTTSAVTIPSLPGGSISVTDGTTTVSPASVVDFTSNATVTRSGTTAEVAVSGGGSTPGIMIVRHFPFAHNTPGLASGASLYTPTIGDIFYDVWIEIDIPWDGTTPLADVGTFVGDNRGIFGISAPIDMTMVDLDNNQAGDGVLSGDGSGSGFINEGLVNNLYQGGTVSGYRQLPAKFTAANPIKVCVSQTGMAGGADPDATQGAGVLYLVTATPA